MYYNSVQYASYVTRYPQDHTSHIIFISCLYVCSIRVRNLSDQVKFNWQLDIAMIPSKLFVTIRKLALVRGVVCIKIDISKMICLNEATK